MNTDEELIKLISTGDEQAEDELLERYKNLIVKISRRYFLVGGDIEDIIQEGMFGLYKAIKGFSQQKNTSFKTFAIICIKHQIQTAIKKANTNKNRPLSTTVSLQSYDTLNESMDFLPIELVLDISPDEELINKENLTDLKNKIKSSLSSLEYKVLQLFLQGYSYKEISQTLKVSSKSIDNSLTRIKTKLRKKLQEN